MVDAGAGDRDIHEADARDRRSPNYPEFLKSVDLIAATAVLEMATDPQCGKDSIINALVAAFAFGYEWRQIVEHRRAIQRN